MAFGKSFYWWSSPHGVDRLPLPSGKTVAVAGHCFDRGCKGTELLPQRPDYRFDLIRACEGCVPDIGKHLVTAYHASAGAEQRPHHLVLQPCGWFVPAVQDELTTCLVELAASRWQRPGRLLASKERM